MTNDQAPMTIQAPMTNEQSGLRSLVIAAWSLTGHWDLATGHSSFESGFGFRISDFLREEVD
jgi:hypothetical protein